MKPETMERVSTRVSTIRQLIQESDNLEHLSTIRILESLKAKLT